MSRTILTAAETTAALNAQTAYAAMRYAAMVRHPSYVCCDTTAERASKLCQRGIHHCASIRHTCRTSGT